MADSLRRIELQEYGDPVILSVDSIDLRTLEDANQRWSKILGLSKAPLQIRHIGNGLISLRAEAVTGVVRIGDVDVEIAPKFLNTEGKGWQSVLWQILTAVEGGHIDGNLTTINHADSLSIPDLLAEVFLDSFSKGAARGLPRGYASTALQGFTLRGKFDSARVSEWIARPWELPYITDFLTDETPLARLLRWAAECLVTTVKSPVRARAMNDISISLSHIERAPPHILDAQRIFLGPQHQGLEGALLVGLLLLEGGGVAHAYGKYLLSGFLWNSDYIYENYVYWLCQKAATECGYKTKKGEISFGEVLSGRGVKLKTTPDVVFQASDGIPICVTDAKYKRLGMRPKAADTYQILTAAHVLGCRRVSLTYPVAYEREPIVWRIESALGSEPVELTALPINLMGLNQPNGQKSLIRALKTWLTGEIYV